MVLDLKEWSQSLQHSEAWSVLIKHWSVPDIYWYPKPCVPVFTSLPVSSSSSSHIDLSYNRPGSSWPDKLHSQRPFPSLGKKVCIPFSPTTVTNKSRGVVWRGCPLLEQSLNWKQLLEMFTFFTHVSLTFISTTYDIHGSQHSNKGKGRTRGDSSLWRI